MTKPSTPVPDASGGPPGEGHTHGGIPCSEAISELYRYLDHELGHETQAAIEAHLRECSPCLEAFDFEAELRKVIVAHSAERCPDALRARILALFEQHPPAP